MEVYADAEMAPRLARALFIHRSMKCHTSAVMNRHTSLWTQELSHSSPVCESFL